VGFFGVGSGFFLCWFVFPAGKTQIWPADLRVVAVAGFLFFVLFSPWICLVSEAKGFLLAHYFTASLIVRTEP
jgi:hypothetical protein